MLYVSLIFSAVLMVLASAVAWPIGRIRSTDLRCGLSLVAGVFLLCLSLTCGSNPVALQGLLLCGSLVACGHPRRGPLTFLGFSCGATLVAYAVVGVFVYQ